MKFELRKIKKYIIYKYQTYSDSYKTVTASASEHCAVNLITELEGKRELPYASESNIMQYARILLFLRLIIFIITPLNTNHNMYYSMQ